MYFWRIEALKDQLRQGPLAQRYAFAYVFIAFLLLEAVLGVPGLWNTELAPDTPWAWVTYIASVAFFGGGTYAAYRANGGANGLDFAARYLALGWVLTVRLVVLAFLPLLLVAMVVLVVMAVAQTDPASVAIASDDLSSDWIVELVSVAFIAVFYWRLVHHFQDVARYAPAVKRIEDLHDADMHASKAGDFATLRSLMSDDAVVLPPGGRLIRGREALDSSFAAMSAAVSSTEVLEYRFDWQEVQVLGDYAFEWGYIHGKERDKASGAIRTELYHVMRILQRQIDGAWKVHRTIWNEPAK
jgi:uncharacterized protein (TIGR02246 family)